MYNIHMKNEEQPNYSPDAKAQVWNAETKSFETWHVGDCEFCGEAVDRKTGECRQYKCWI